MTPSASWPNIYFIYTVPKELTLKISFILEMANTYFRGGVYYDPFPLLKVI
jgi:hypothetical protein